MSTMPPSPKFSTAATHAPSAENSQPFVFIVVRDPALRSAIGGIAARVWEGGARALETGRLTPALLDEVDRGARGGVAGAPVLVVVCGDARLTFAPTLGASVFPAVQNLLLAAHALGLGSALTTLPVLGGNELSELLGLPDEVEPLAVVPLGHPARHSGRRAAVPWPRRPISTATGCRSLRPHSAPAPVSVPPSRPGRSPLNGGGRRTPRERCRSGP